MNKRDLRRYEDRLTALRDRLTSDVTQMVETVQSSANAPGEHDSFVNESLKKEFVLEGIEEELCSEVVAALRRIEDGRFGKCQRCGRVIAKERLEAVPYTPFCIGCERKAEAGTSLETVT